MGLGGGGRLVGSKDIRDPPGGWDRSAPLGGSLVPSFAPSPTPGWALDCGLQGGTVTVALLAMAVEQLNIKAKNFRDLLTDEPFCRQDIITLQVITLLAPCLRSLASLQPWVTPGLCTGHRLAVWGSRLPELVSAPRALQVELPVSSPTGLGRVPRTRGRGLEHGCRCPESPERAHVSHSRKVGALVLLWLRPYDLRPVHGPPPGCGLSDPR